MVTDIHEHFVPPGFVDYSALYSDGRWPALVVEGADSRIIQRGLTYRRVSRSYFDIHTRVLELDQLGIDHQILSPLPMYMPSWAARGRATSFCSMLNNALAEICSVYPNRFS